MTTLTVSRGATESDMRWEVGLNSIKRDQIWSKLTKQGQTGINICQKELNRAKRYKQASNGI